MDPFTHTFTGAALAASGLRKRTPLATATLLLGANAPDIDILASGGGTYMSLAYRRGWTHGALAWLVLPFLVTAMMLAWDRLVRRRGKPEIEPADGLALLMLSALAVLSHAALDWLNNYGIRLLMPFDRRWFYGDALFVVDPWAWLLLGGGCFLAWSRHKASLPAWLLWWIAATWVVWSNAYVESATRLIWLAGLLCLLGWRYFRPAMTVESPARWALALVAVYMGASAIANRLAVRDVEEQVQAGGNHQLLDVMVGPWPTDPFRGNVVAVTSDRYLLGSWNWLAHPHLQLAADSIARDMDSPVVRAAAGSIQARRFLVWSRYPYATVQPAGQGYSVHFGDARYAQLGNLISGPVVTLNQGLGIVSSK